MANIRPNIRQHVRTGKIGVKGLVVEYGEYSEDYSLTESSTLLPAYMTSNTCRAECPLGETHTLLLALARGLAQAMALHTKAEFVNMLIKVSQNLRNS